MRQIHLTRLTRFVRARARFVSLARFDSPDRGVWFHAGCP